MSCEGLSVHRFFVLFQDHADCIFEVKDYPNRILGVWPDGSLVGTRPPAHISRCLFGRTFSQTEQFDPRSETIEWLWDPCPRQNVNTTEVGLRMLHEHDWRSISTTMDSYLMDCTCQTQGHDNGFLPGSQYGSSSNSTLTNI